MRTLPLASRLARLPVATTLGFEVREAVSFRSRLLGLAFLDQREAGAGLLIPRSSSIHTFGMRFLLNVLFLDENGLVTAVHRNVKPHRFLFCSGAAAVLEISSAANARAERNLPGFVLNPVGERRQLADTSVQGGSNFQQRCVARVADAALQAADMGQMNVGGIGKRLLA